MAPRSRIWPIAGVLLLAVVLFAVGFALFVRRPPPAADLGMYAAPIGKRVHATLHDGTTLILAPGSRLRLSAGYGEKGRHVFLEGEAYFDVAHDPSSVFTVHTGSITTRALGTQFDVRAFAEERKIRVAVLEGTVAFDDTAIMNAGSVARRTADGVLTRLPNTDPTALTAWTQGTLSFTNVPLSEVLPQLKRWYGLTVYLANTQLGKRTLTATFHGTDTPSTVLDAIAHQLDVHVEHRGLDILIR